jgi:hypothetical protein
MKANEHTLSFLDRAVIGTFLLAATMLFAVQAVHAAEIVPSIGLAMPTNGGTDTKPFFGLAVRNGILPVLKSEISVSYRIEAIGGGSHVKSWPVTASLYATPIPTLYAGAGVGWYQTSISANNNLLFSDGTERRFGMHVCGGFSMPLGPLA